MKNEPVLQCHVTHKINFNCRNVHRTIFRPFRLIINSCQVSVATMSEFLKCQPELGIVLRSKDIKGFFMLTIIFPHPVHIISQM